MTTPIDTTRLREACVDVEAAAAAVAAAEKAPFDSLPGWHLSASGSWSCTGSGSTGDNAKPRAKERAQVALFRADDNLTRAAFVLAENRASILALLDEVDRLRARPTWERVINLANGCHDYRGGRHGAEYEAFQHGIETVCNVMRAASEQGDQPSYQLRVVEAVGADVEEGSTR